MLPPIVRRLSLIVLMASLPGGAFGQKPKNKPEAAKPQNHPAVQPVDREKVLREWALSILSDMSQLNDLDNRIEAAHMKSDIAFLMCAIGEGERGADLYRKSLVEIGQQLLVTVDEITRAESDLFELFMMIWRRAYQCDPSIVTLTESELKQILILEKQKVEALTKQEPLVVEDGVYLTKPSIGRELVAETIARVALQTSRPDEAENLLYQSLKSCVTSALMTGITYLRKNSAEAANNLFINAARRVQSLPSGAEIVYLEAELNLLLEGSFPDGKSLASIYQPNPLLDAYLDAVVAFIKSIMSEAAIPSLPLLETFKNVAPLIAKFRPSVRWWIEEWVKEASRPTSRGYRRPMIPSRHKLFDKVSMLQNTVSKTIDVKERDRLYAAIASGYGDAGYFSYARESASNIKDFSLRTEILDEIAFKEASAAIDRGTGSRTVMQIIEKVTSVPMQVKLYAMLGKAEAKRNYKAAIESLDEAARLASKMDFSPARSHLLLMVADAFIDVDQGRAFEVLGEAVKSFDKNHEQPPARWGHAYLVLPKKIELDPTGNLARTIIENPEEYIKRPYDLAPFRKLVRADFDGVLLVSNKIKDKSLYQSARFEICAGILLGDEVFHDKMTFAPPR